MIPNRTGPSILPKRTLLVCNVLQVRSDKQSAYDLKIDFTHTNSFVYTLKNPTSSYTSIIFSCLHLHTTHVYAICFYMIDCFVSSYCSTPPNCVTGPKPKREKNAGSRSPGTAASHEQGDDEDQARLFFLDSGSSLYVVCLFMCYGRGRVESEVKS